MAKRSTAALIFYKHKLLLTLRDNSPDIPDPNCWDVPGGSCEGDEIYEDCLQRELKEELELEIDKSRFKFVWEELTIRESLEHAYTFAIDDKEKSLLKLHEGQRIEYFDFDELVKIKLTRFLKKMLIEKKDILKRLFDKNNI